MNAYITTYADDAVLGILRGEDALLDTLLLKIEIFERDNVKTVRFEFRMRPKSRFASVRLEFVDVEEYGFYASANYGNHIERYKLFRTESDRFYISLDPIDEVEWINVKDQDFVLAASVALEVLR